MGNNAAKHGDLIDAAGAGDIDGVRRCLARGLSVDGTDEDGWTALMHSAKNGDVGMMRVLLKSDASIYKEDNNGATALFTAAYWGHVYAVQVLVESGADVSEKDDSGATALFYAALRGHVDAVRVLVKLGANVNEKDNNGLTALFFAGANGHARVVEVLTQLSTSANHSNVDTDSSLQDARRAGHLNSAEREELAKSPATAPLVEMPSTEDDSVKVPPEAKDHALNQFLVVKLSRVLPNVLNSLQDRCSRMREAEEMSKRVFSRLQRIFQQLHSINVSVNKIALRQYSDVIARFDQFVRQHEKYDFATRAVACLEVAKNVLQFHKAIDQVESALDLPRSSIPKETADEDRQKLLKIFRGICDDSESISVHISNDQARLDAIILLRNVLTGSRRSKSRCDYWELIRNLEAKLMSFSSDSPDAVIADWFMPPYQVKCDEIPFSQGSFGAVYRATMYGADVVVKQVLTFDDGARTQFLKEVQVWNRLRHPHVLPFLGACHIGKFFFVCEYASHGTLPQFLKKGANRQMTWGKLHEVALGLRYLHSLEIIHGDMKGNNLLVGADGKAKLADFGLSLIVASSTTMKPEKLGAPRWRAPEVLTGECITMESDIFAFGMCIIEAVSGEYPWGNALLDAVVRRNVKNGTPIPRPGGFTNSQWELVTKTSAHQRSERIEIDAVVDALDDFRVEEQASRVSV